MGLALTKHFAGVEEMSERVLVVNRGHVHWDDECSRVMAKCPNRFIKVKADRDRDDFASIVKEAIGSSNVVGVIDFSCYDIKAARRGVEAVPHDSRYLYISSDSCYNANGLLIEKFGEKGAPELELYKIYDQYE